jgi:hypothetical protein
VVHVVILGQKPAVPSAEAKLFQTGEDEIGYHLSVWRSMALVETVESSRRRYRDARKTYNTQYKDAKKIYDEYRRLRETLGRSTSHPLDPEKIRKDLSSEEFFQILPSLREKKIG